jgi:hypothetical protein
LFMVDFRQDVPGWMRARPIYQCLTALAIG